MRPTMKASNKLKVGHIHVVEALKPGPVEGSSLKVAHPKTFGVDLFPRSRLSSLDSAAQTPVSHCPGDPHKVPAIF